MSTIPKTIEQQGASSLASLHSEHSWTFRIVSHICIGPNSCSGNQDLKNGTTWWSSVIAPICVYRIIQNYIELDMSLRLPKISWIRRRSSSVNARAANTSSELEFTPPWHLISWETQGILNYWYHLIPTHTYSYLLISTGAYWYLPIPTDTDSSLLGRCWGWPWWTSTSKTYEVLALNQ